MDKKTSGFTLIEMLVGTVIGMIVVAAASVMMVSVLKSQKDVTASARLNQDLGAAMAVMSNEIRRTGFSICDIKKMHDETPPLACPDNVGGEEVPYITYAPGEDLKIDDVDGDLIIDIDGDCILYRYNADLDGDGYDGDTDVIDDDDDGDLSEHRGFRLKDNIIEMALYPANHNGVEIKCDDDPSTVAEYKWINLTDINVINITKLTFSTTGSRCRNMELPDPNPPVPSAPAVIAQYWVVKDIIAPDIQIGAACENGTTPVDYCIVTENAANPVICTPNEIVGSGSVVTSPGELFGARQIRITLNGVLTRDLAVKKSLKTIVKIANPRIEIVP